jgi:hypothetical protein
VSITISINDAPSTITTVLSPVVLSHSVGSFITDSVGVLTTAPTEWNDDATLSTVVSSNDPAGTADLMWWINGGNNVYYHDDLSAGVYVENVGNIILPAFWTGPGPAMAPATATPVPTLSQWAIILLSLMLLAIGFVKTRRFS